MLFCILPLGSKPSVFSHKSSGSNTDKSNYAIEQADIVLEDRDCGNHKTGIKGLDTDEVWKFKQLAEFYYEQSNHVPDLLLNISFCFLYPNKDTNVIP